MPDFSQIWENKSSTPFHLLSWNCDTDTALGTVNTSPGANLPAGVGVEKLAWTQALSTFAGGLTDGEIVWHDGKGNKFGVQIHVPLQILFIGTAPYYRTRTGNDDWAGQYTSDTITFDKSKVGGYNITIHPTAEHSSLALKIEITD